MGDAVLIDRRLLLQARLGAGVLALPAWAQALAARGFTHDVASGEPRSRLGHAVDALRPGAGAISAAALASRTRRRFRARSLAAARSRPTPERDWCVKPVADGARRRAAGTTTASSIAAGQSSPVGRTRTLPDGPVEQVQARRVQLREPAVRLLQRLRPRRRAPRHRPDGPPRRLHLRIPARHLSRGGAGACRAA